MIFQNTSHTYPRQTQGAAVLNGFRKKKFLELVKPTGLPALPVCKCVGAVLAVTLILSFWFGSLSRENALQLMVVSQQRHELVDQNLFLLAQKAELYSPASIQMNAEQKLSLRVAERGQGNRFNR